MPTEENHGWRSKLLEIALGVAAAVCLMLVTGLNSRISDLESRLRIAENTAADIKAINVKLDAIWNWAGLDRHAPPEKSR